MYRFLGSRLFFRIIVGTMIFQALWIALTANYPMAFDEDFHFGLIKLYADHPSPFWASHPASGDAFGPLTRDASYMFHWLMGFVLQLIRLFTDNESVQVIILRLLNISLFTSSLVLFRRLLLRTQASPAIVHSSLAIYILIPVVPLLAAHINYDNVFIPLTVICLLLADNVAKSFRAKTWDFKTLLLLVATCMFTSIIKYAFLPIFVGVVIYLAAVAYKTRAYKSAKIKAALAVFWKQSRLQRTMLLVGLAVMFGLFFERIGLNMIRYHAPMPDCAQVLTIEQCSAYGPWNRDYNLSINRPADAPTSPVTFTERWVRGMWMRTFFTLAGPTIDHQTKGPLTVPALSAIAFAVIGTVLSFIYGRRVLRRYNGPLLTLFLVVCAVYLSLLWVDVYQLFLHAGKAVAINGRYLLVIWPLLIVFAALACREALAKLPRIKTLLPVLVIACMLWGGGVMTYMIRSEDSWYWPGSAPRAVNQAAKKALVPITPGSQHPSQLLR